MKAFVPFLKTLLLCVFLFAGSAFANEVVNINTADAATLSRVLNGIGPSKAQAIIDYRQQHGPFKSVEELVNVRGIGLATVERNIERMSVGNNAAAQARPTTTRTTAQAPAATAQPRRTAQGSSNNR